MEEKREIPSTLRKFLAVDAYLTHAFVSWAEQINFFKQLKTYHKAFDISCNGIGWLGTNLMLIWVLNYSNLYQMQVNLLIGLILDIILVAVLKAFTRRRRPTINGSLTPEKDSFPSGHASRITYISYFFLYLWPISLIYTPFLLAWVFSVCMCKLLMRKHHISDILVGIALGIFQSLLIKYIYLERKTCTSLIWWITEENLSGAEYDV
ncbi:hypothetical protein PUN28_019303 [Cardiocondyla obscurior]